MRESSSVMTPGWSKSCDLGKSQRLEVHAVICGHCTTPLPPRDGGSQTPHRRRAAGGPHICARDLGHTCLGRRHAARRTYELRKFDFRSWHLADMPRDAANVPAPLRNVGNLMDALKRASLLTRRSPRGRSAGRAKCCCLSQARRARTRRRGLLHDH
jgi:hypothetical protein